MNDIASDIVTTLTDTTDPRLAVGTIIFTICGAIVHAIQRRRAKRNKQGSRPAAPAASAGPTEQSNNVNEP